MDEMENKDFPKEKKYIFIVLENPPNWSAMPPEESHSQQIETEMHGEKNPRERLLNFLNFWFRILIPLES